MLTQCIQYLKSKKPEVQVVAVEPAESPVLSGGKPGPHKIQGIGAGFVPENCHLELVDEVFAVSSEDAIAKARVVATQEGVFIGISSGAAIHAAVEVRWMRKIRTSNNIRKVLIKYTPVVRLSPVCPHMYNYSLRWVLDLKMPGRRSLSLFPHLGRGIFPRPFSPICKGRRWHSSRNL